MTSGRAVRFTLNILFPGDAMLNWFLGFTLVLFPSTIDSLLGRRPLAPELVYQVAGVGFLVFAAWQTMIVFRRRIGSPGLVFAALMAEIPVVLLTVVLVFLKLEIVLIWRVVLWLGNVYMLLLGVWYMFVARRLVTDDTKWP